eukprot:TRINITY_DN46369_c0_g1_i1.p1 TRINITY_DN46369_c0_g1~~TRINITY_DN46369_c0_g1_i1.p1  ORF type:complete len:512 (-),score=129.35 TRINITY_DN46369_c0_g1_i1:4-1539(-)
MSSRLFSISSLLEANLLTICSVLLLSLLCIGVLDLVLDRRKNLYHIPGPVPIPFAGNALLLLKPHDQIMGTIASLCAKYGPVMRFHIGPRVNALVSSAEGFEKILSSNKQITKGKDYQFLLPWLGTGLLTSTGTKWHTRRKMLTPAFHFRILEDFLDVMNQQTELLCDILDPLCGGPAFDVFPLVTHCALDIICETAMGKSINAQADSDTEYVRAIYGASDIVFQRQKSPWLWQDWLFALTPAGFRWRKYLKSLHGLTTKVIEERKKEVEKTKSGNTEDDVGIKRRLAFLDLLIDASEGGSVLSDEDIREEVDTFMFEGHDTTATNMSFTLYLLATHPEVQTRCQEELDKIFGKDTTRPATSQDLAKMKYIETCLKEALRLYQSVPIMSRMLAEDVEIEGHLIPAKTNVILLSFLLHRDPEAFPNPDQFDPDRFSVDNPQKRNPYSYVPFSAGPRNCIGQKFALMEEKVLVSSILRRFSLRSNVMPSEIPLLAEVILRPKNGLHLSIEKRE